MRKRGFTLRQAQGFTLIEVLASIALISVAIIPVAKALTQGLALSAKEERVTKVIFLAERKIEELENIILDDFDTHRDKVATAFTDDGYSGYKYTVSDTVIERDGSDLKKIQVQVWYDEDNDNKVDSGEESITLDTKIAERS